MNKSEFAKIMKELNIAYGDKKFPLTKEVLDVWYKYLGDCCYSEVLSSLEHHVRTSVFPPAVSEILEYIDNIKKRVLIRSTEERKVYLSIIANYPTATDSYELREVYREIVSDDFQKANYVLDKIKETVSNWEETGKEDIPSICEFLKALNYD